MARKNNRAPNPTRMRVREKRTVCQKTGKVRFNTLLDAGTALAHLATQRVVGKRDASVHKEERIYECEFCRGYHFTSQPKGRQ